MRRHTSKPKSNGKALEGELMSGGAKTVKHGSAHLRPYLPPWAGWLALPVIPNLTHALAETSTAGGVAVGGVVCAGGLGLAAFTWHVFGPRAHSIRVQATATVSAAVAWTMWTTASGLFQDSALDGWNIPGWLLGYLQPWPWGAWALLGPIGAILWNVRRLSRGEGHDAHKDNSDLMEKVGIAARVKKVELEGDDTRVRAGYEVERGTHTAADVQGARDRLAAVLGVRPTAIRIAVDPDDHGKGEMVVTPRDLLAGEIAWPGPSAPGTSLADSPIPAGQYEDGEVAKIWFCGDPQVGRNAAHFAVGGMTGAGKTESALPVLTDAMTRRDVEVMFSDPVKGVQAVGPIAHGIGLLLTDRAQATAAFRKLGDVITDRTNQLGKYGFKQWTKEAARPVGQGGAGIKFLICWFEEAADLLADSERVVKYTEQARSAGISLVLSQQRFSHDRINTSARSNLTAAWCFGVRDEQDAKFILSDDTLDAGAAPWTWGAFKPGYSYLEAPGTDRARWAVPLRGHIADEAELTDAVDRYVTDPTFDETTATAFGKVYIDYRATTDTGTAIWQNMATATTSTPAAPTAPATPSGPVAAAVPAVRVVMATGPQPEDLDDDEDPDLVDVDGEDDDADDPDFVPPEQPEPGFMPDETIDIEQEIPDDAGDTVIEIGPPRPRNSIPTADARAALRAALDQMVDAGEETVEPHQLVELRRHIDRGAPWLTKELQRLVDEGYLTDEPERGVYGLPSREFAQAA